LKVCENRLELLLVDGYPHADFIPMLVRAVHMYLRSLRQQLCELRTGHRPGAPQEVDLADVGVFHKAECVALFIDNDEDGAGCASGPVSGCAA